MKKLIFLFLIAFPCAVFAQTKSVPKPAANVQAVKNSPAYAELLLRRTELEAKIEDFLVDYTEEYPKLKEARYELAVLNKENEKLLAVSDVSKLNLALGKLILRKAELETDLWALRQQYNDEHPDVKRAARKAAAFEKAIKEILP